MGQLANNSYILQTEPKLRVNAVPSGECNLLLDVTPSNPLPHPLSPLDILLCVIQM